jgi:hypothetical protein
MSFEQSKYFITFDEYNKLADEITKDEYDKMVFKNQICYGSIQTTSIRTMKFMYYLKLKFNNPEELKQYLFQLIETDERIKRCEYYGLPSNCTKEDIEKKESEEKGTEDIRKKGKKQIGQFIDIMHNEHSNTDFDLLLKSSSEDIAENIIKDLDNFFKDNIINGNTPINEYLNWSTMKPTHKSFELEIDLDFLIHFKTLKHRGYDCSGTKTSFGPNDDGIITLYSDINEILDILCMHLLEAEDDNIDKMLFIFRYFDKYYHRGDGDVLHLFIDTLDRLIKDQYINLFDEGTDDYIKFCWRKKLERRFSINNKIIQYYMDYYKSGESVIDTLKFMNQEIEEEYKQEYINELLEDRNKVAEKKEKEAKKKYLKYKQKYLNLKYI